jgi:hypothetical protein
MPEHDFELYLSLLSRFLRLKAAQRDEIADELRDHLEARLEELAARGLSRDEAIKAALDEFGDAAELAQHFTHVAHVRKRRIIMRYTFGTAAALAAAILITTAFWPESKQAPVGAMGVVEAQDSGKGAAPATKLPLAGGPADNSDKAVVEAKLSRRLEEGFELMDVPLRDALEQLGELLGVDIIIDPSIAGEEGLSLDVQVTVQIRRTKISGRAALDLVLEPAKLSYTFRDGLIMVTIPQNANQIQVYNVRDLVRQSHDSYGGSGMPMGGAPGMMGPGGSMGPSGMSSMGRSAGMMMAGMAAGGGAHAEGSVGMGGLGGGMGGGGTPAIRETNSLAELIATTIDPASWDGEGGHGSIIQYQELLVVKNSQTVHGKIRTLLEMMRETAQRPPGSTAGAPPGMGMPAGGPGAAPGAIPPGAPPKR